MTNTKVSTAHIPLDLADKVDAAAGRLDRSRGWVMKQALAAWVDQEEDRHRMTLEALGDVDAGHLIDHHLVQAWSDNLSAGDPLPRRQSPKKHLECRDRVMIKIYKILFVMVIIFNILFDALVFFAINFLSPENALAIFLFLFICLLLIYTRYKFPVSITFFQMVLLSVQVIFRWGSLKNPTLSGWIGIITCALLLYAFAIFGMWLKNRITRVTVTELR